MFENQIRQRLAVGIIVDNEWNRLDRTIENAKYFSDNVFILGINSSEVTAAVIEQADIKKNFLSVLLCNDFSEARNRMLEQVEKSCDAQWMLWLYAGEHFDLSTFADFELFLEKEANLNSLYFQILRRNFNEDGSRHDWDEETIDARLMPLRKGLRFSGPVKEDLFQSATNLMIQLSAAPGRIVGPTKYVDQHTRLLRGARNLRILENLQSQGNVIEENLLLFQAEVRADLNDWAAARNDCLRLIRETAKTNLRLEGYYRFCETTILSPIQPNEMTQVLLQALDHFPVDMQLLTLMGKHMQGIGHWDIAMRTFDTAIRYGQISLDVWHYRHIREIAVVALSLLHRLQGNQAEAIQVLENNLDQIEDPSDYVRYMFDLYISEFQEFKAHDVAAKVFKGKQLDMMHDAISGACRAAIGTYEAAILPLKTAYDDGCRDILCLRWYALSLLSLKQFEDAIPIIEEWNTAAPDSSEAKAYLTAAQDPTSFDETIKQIKAKQQQIFGSMAKTSQHQAKQAVQEMVGSSGKISVETLNENAMPVQFEIEIAGDSSNELYFEM